MNGPLPSKLVFIHELPSLPLHTKVRFLGCVVKYDVEKCRLVLEHNFPPSSSNARNSKIAVVPVDIYHVLDTVKGDALQFGTWLNIFGYVRSDTQDSREKDDFKNDVYVQAIMISDAGAIRVAEYEQSIVDMRAIKRRLRQDSE